MAKRSIDLHVTAGEPRTGGWCERCALPSLVEVDIFAMSAEGKLAGVSKLRTLKRCTNHG